MVWAMDMGNGYGKRVWAMGMDNGYGQWVWAMGMGMGNGYGQWAMGSEHEQWVCHVYAKILVFARLVFTSGFQCIWVW